MRTVLVTGAASGIGLATVRYLLAQGDNVIGFDQQVGGLDDVKASYDNFLFHQGNVCDLTALESAAAHAIDRFGSLSAVVTCAGIYLHKALHELAEAEWDEVMAVNVKGSALAVRACLPQFLAQGEGVVVLLGSDQCDIPKAHSIAYAASKGAVRQLMRSIANDYVNQGVRANLVSPATLRTAMTEACVQDLAALAGDDIEATWSRIAEEQPLGGLIAAEKVAEAIGFLLSDAASQMSGSELVMDGGYRLRHAI